MVIKVKVSDVAAGFGVQNKEVLDLLAQCGAAKKSPSTVLEEGELNALFDRITKTHSVENFDKFYALRSNKPKSQAPQQKRRRSPSLPVIRRRTRSARARLLFCRWRSRRLSGLRKRPRRRPIKRPRRAPKARLAMWIPE